MLRNTLQMGIAIGCAVSLSTSLIAADFTIADELFAQREGSLENTLAARDAYKAIVAEGVTGAELERAVEGMARTYVYQGEVLTGKVSDEDVEARRTIFRECWKDTMPLIAPEKLGFESPVYYYFMGSCLAYYGEVSGTLENLGNIGRLTRAIDGGLAIQGGPEYEGGGLKRVKAAIISNEKVKPLPGGLYNPEEALTLIDEAILTEPYGDSPDGFFFCENYRRKYNVLIELERNDDAVALAEQTLVDFDLYLSEELIPSSMIPETKHCLAVIQESIAPEVTEPVNVD